MGDLSKDFYQLQSLGIFLDLLACLLLSYIVNRKQQIKIGNIVSTWANIQKGVPQGSILGPLLFNVFINDIFYFIKHCDLYNYADDNTLSSSHDIFAVPI
jgi:hypothetical protein